MTVVLKLYYEGKNGVIGVKVAISYCNAKDGDVVEISSMLLEIFK